MPNPLTFPVSKINVELTDGTSLSVDTPTALQYSGSRGIGPLVEFLTELQRKEHCPPQTSNERLQVCVTNGSQDALTKTFEMILDPSEGDALIIESPTYSGTLAFLEPFGARLVEIPTDGEGMVTSALRERLDGWDEARDGKKPRAVYTVPTGSNPTGVSMSEERRRDLYSIAQDHNLLIVEDDPYHFLQFSGKRKKSIFSLDTDGRVIRFDSFSKLVSAGIRMGFASGPRQLIERLELHMQATELHASGVSQGVLAALLLHWGHEGFEAHVGRVAEFYRQRRDAFVKHAETHLAGKIRFEVPDAGMFVWMELLAPEGLEDATDLIKSKAVEGKVLLLPGSCFFPGERKSRFVRAAFSTASSEQMEEALKRLSALLS